MILVGLDVHENDEISHFRFDLPVTYVNTIGLPTTTYFQGRSTPAEIKWFKDKETPYVLQLLNYEWDKEAMANAPDLKRMYHFKINRNAAPIGIPRELFWNKRRDKSFQHSFDVANEAEAAINNTTTDNNTTSDKSYDMADFLLTPQFRAKGWCKECADDSDEVFVFRQLNGYRKRS